VLSPVNFNFSCLENKNWNILWESNFNPIMIGKSCFIRAPFHKKRKVKYDILINPKMAFGTGHHETTKMMILELLNLKERPKKALDVGCGTGILSIILEKMYKSDIKAIDIDDWAIENSLENIKMNKCSNIEIEKGNIDSQVKNSKFDLILANINTSVLVQDLKSYFHLLELNGLLIMSGFLSIDFSKIQKEASFLNLFLISKQEEKKWQCVVFKKIN
jgi:ribosomal protein L11 methyltransferase